MKNKNKTKKGKIKDESVEPLTFGNGTGEFNFVVQVIRHERDNVSLARDHASTLQSRLRPLRTAPPHVKAPWTLLASKNGNQWMQMICYL